MGPLQHLIDQYDRATRKPKPDRGGRRHGAKVTSWGRTGWKWVYPVNGRYVARPKIAGAAVHLGTFDTPEEAAAAVAARLAQAKGEGA